MKTKTEDGNGIRKIKTENGRPPCRFFFSKNVFHVVSKKSDIKRVTYITVFIKL